MKLNVGLDVSSEKLDACFLGDEPQDIYLEASFSNDTVGASQIKQKVLELNTKYNFDRIIIGMEATSIYSFHPALFFENDEDLIDLKVKTFVENPRSIKKYVESYDEDKTDRNDAFFVADYFRVGRGKKSIIREEKYLALQRLTRARYQMVEQMAKTKQHFLQNLGYKVNTLTKELAKGTSTNVFSATVIDLMTEDLSLDEIAEMPLEKFAELIQKKGRGRFKDPEKLAKTIKKAIRSSYRLGKVMTESIDTILGIQAREIRSLKKSIKEFDKAIEDLVQTMPEHKCLESIPGVGPVYAGGILAEIGQIERFTNQAGLAKYAGLTWKKHNSGKHQSENTPLRRTGNHFLRYYLVEAANSVIRHVPEYKAFYQMKAAEVPRNKHKRAVTMTARKFTRLVYTLLSEHQLYMPQEEVYKDKS